MSNARTRRPGVLPSLLSLSIGAAGCGGAEPKPAPPPEPHAAPTFTLAPPGESLPPEIAQLLQEVDVKNVRLAETARAIAESGNATARQRAGQKLVQIATEVASPAWQDRRRAEVRESNASDGFAASEAQLASQLERLQTEALAPVFLAMEALGGAEVVEHAFGVARDPAVIPERRSMAFGVVAAHLAAGDHRASEVKGMGEDIERRLAATLAAGATLSSAGETLGGLRSTLKKCYEDVLPKNPGLSVKGTLALTIDPKGKVREAKALDLAPTELAECVEKAGRDATFEPAAAERSMRMPIVFTSQ
jgi:hypothetical protein